MWELFHKCAYDETETMSHTDRENKMSYTDTLILLPIFIKLGIGFVKLSIN